MGISTWDCKYYSHRVEGSIPVRGNFFAELILFQYNHGIVARMIHFMENSTVGFNILIDSITNFDISDFFRLIQICQKCQIWQIQGFYSSKNVTSRPNNRWIKSPMFIQLCLTWYMFLNLRLLDPKMVMSHWF